MTGWSNIAFLDYWTAVDAAMRKRYRIDSLDAGIEAETVASAQEDGWTPEELVAWFGDKYGLITWDEWRVLLGRC